jgi:hypothetical protein
MKFRLTDAYGTTYNNDICINISDASRNGVYEPYKESILNLSWIKKYFPNGMRSDGSVRDEISFNTTTQKWEAVQRVGSDNLALTEPIVTEIIPSDISYKAFEGGTEVLSTESISTPITAEIAYNYDARSNIEILKQEVENKADKATTLKGYGITDAYTDAEVNDLIKKVKQDIQEEYLPITKVQSVTLLTLNGNITKDVYNAMVTADVVKILYGGTTGNPQYELTMSAKEKSNGRIMYSTVFFSTIGNVFKSFSVIFASPSNGSNAVSYQVTLSNLAIGAASIAE